MLYVWAGVPGVSSVHLKRNHDGSFLITLQTADSELPRNLLEKSWQCGECAHVHGGSHRGVSSVIPMSFMTETACYLLPMNEALSERNIFLSQVQIWVHSQRTKPESILVRKFHSRLLDCLTIGSLKSPAGSCEIKKQNELSSVSFFGLTVLQHLTMLYIVIRPKNSIFISCWTFYA